MVNYTLHLFKSYIPLLYEILKLLSAPLKIKFVLHFNMI